MKIHNQFLLPRWTVPIALLGLLTVSYGLMAAKLGVHMDDWMLIWDIHFLGPQIFKDVFIEDRPLFGWLYVLTTSLFRESLLGWQIFAIFTRWLSCLALWHLLITLWPRRLTQITAVACLFAVYPGFISLLVPVTYAHHILILAVTLFSLGTSGPAKPGYRPCMVSRLPNACPAYHEYYFGLNCSVRLLRMILMMIQNSARLKRVFIY
jgi:hypothetical protein